jgi:hypothetical protein
MRILRDAEIEATDNGDVIISWWERNSTNTEPVVRISNDNDQMFDSLLRLATNGILGEPSEEKDRLHVFLIFCGQKY